MTTSVVVTLNNLLNGKLESSSSSANSSSSILHSLEHQIEVTLQNVSSLRVIEPSIAISALTIKSPDDVTGGLTFLVKADNDKEYLSDKRVQTLTGEDKIPKSVETSIELPESIFTRSKEIKGKYSQRNITHS